MKSRFHVIVITAAITIALMLMAAYFIYGLHKKPALVISSESPDGSYRAYVTDNPALDPPNQALFISRNGTEEFRLVSELPEDIEYIQQIIWSPDGRNAVFQTNWHLFITDVKWFNTTRISLNRQWWRWHGNRKTFSSSDRAMVIRELFFSSPDTLVFRTDEMERSSKVCLAGE